MSIIRKKKVVVEGDLLRAPTRWTDLRDDLAAIGWIALLVLMLCGGLLVILWTAHLHGGVIWR